MGLFESIASIVSGGESLVMAAVLSRHGSAPRAAGSRMVVRSDGSILGTIGGGTLESRVQELASEVFKTRATLVKEFILGAEDVSSTGMICGGKVQVLIHFVDGGESFQTRFYNDLGAVEANHRRAWLITQIPREERSFKEPEYALLGYDDSFSGKLDFTSAKNALARFSGRQPQVVSLADESFLVEPLAREGSVFIFGAGHIARELAPLAKLVGFRTVVLDDREEFANSRRFPSSDEIHILDSFKKALDGLNISEESYLVIVTRGHIHDKIVLGQALKTDARYIGMIGSRRKRDAIYEALIEEGFTREDIQRVSSPIGLNIGAETPQEIAISIVAELIQVRSRKV